MHDDAYHRHNCWGRVPNDERLSLPTQQSKSLTGTGAGFLRLVYAKWARHPLQKIR